MAREPDQVVHDLHDATRRLVTAETAADIAEATVAAARDVLGHSIAVVWLQEGDERLVPDAATDRARELLGERPVYPVESDTSPARAFRTGEPIVVDDVSALDDDYDRGDVCSAVYLPLDEYGVLSVGATERAAFEAVDRRLAAILADNAGAALASATRQAELAAEHDRLSSLFENVPDPTIRVRFEDGEPYVEAVNPAFEDVFGHDLETVRGASIDDYVVPPDDREQARDFNRRIQSGEPFQGEVERQTADGRRTFDLQVVPHQIGEGSTEGFAIYRDITDRKRRERELERQNDRLETFASVLSHDLRNPLNVATGRVELARKTGDVEHLDEAARALERIGDRIESLLMLARDGEEAIEPTARVALAETARAAWGAVETRGATLSVETESVVVADRPRLERLLENLFANAVEHAPGADGRSADLTVTVGETDDESGFFVSDDGVGLPDDADDLFAWGTSTGGTGLGLAIVESIAEAHGWSVTAGTADGGGARFEVSGVEFIER